MDESSRLKAEIAYWSNLITTHKQTQLAKAQKYSRQPKTFKWAGGNSNRKFNASNEASLTSTRKIHPSLKASLSYNQRTPNKHTANGHNASKYKWKPKPECASSSANNSMHDVEAQSCTRKHKSENLSTSHTPVKKKTFHKDFSSHSASKNESDRYTWSSNKTLQANGHSKEVTRTCSAIRSKHVWRRRRSSESKAKQWQTSTANPTVMVKEIMGKYRLRRVRSKPKLLKSANVSKNPYKVIRNSSSALSPHHAKSSPVRSHYRPNHYRDAYSSSLRYKRSRYKLELSHKVQTQTRNPRSGNIVLKRKQTTRKENSFHIKQQYFYSTKQKLASQVLQKSLHAVRHKNRHKLRKVFCLFYNRFGKCNRGDKCQYVHDPARVAVCTRFLRGTCRDTSCLFSHKISKKKVPVCTFFMQGKCSAKDCPYLHVFVGHSADVCTAFATTGYCQKAENCKQKHIRVCPEFYNKGSCAKGAKCSLPHKSKRANKLRKRKSTFSSKSTLNTHHKSMDGYISLPKTQALVKCKPVVQDGQQIRIQPRLGKKKCQA